MSLLDAAEDRRTDPDCVTAVFDTFDAANHAVAALKESGVGDEHISLITRGAHGDLTGGEHLRQGDKMEKTAAVGAAAGAAVGLLAGSSLLMIPGLGPVLFAGAMASGV